MHDQHATRGHATLRVDRRHVHFLRETFDAIRAGRLGDLIEPFDASPAVLKRIRAEAETCETMIEGLGRGAIVADPAARAILAEQAAATDEENEYERTVEEHEAFAHLLRQLDPRPVAHGDVEVAPDVCRQRRLLWELLAPPAYGGFIAQLARILQATLADTQATAVILQDKGLAMVRGAYVAASGAAMNFDEVRRTACRVTCECRKGDSG